MAYNLNHVVSAETVMMLKERVIERYGHIRYTIGKGCSGGSMQAHLIAAGYSGLLDGIEPMCSYPDVLTVNGHVTDCRLLFNAFDRVPALRELTPAQRTAITGGKSTIGCRDWHENTGDTGDPTNASTCALPKDLVYHPVTNPKGTRCTSQDYQRAIWGLRAQDGFAKRVTNNVGIQYGLAALKDGTITPAQFVALNADIGGLDIDWKPQAERMRPDPGTLTTAYRTGQVSDARQLASVPIIDLRPYIEDDVHISVYSYQTRARLDRDNGGHGNQVIWTWPAGPATPPAALDELSFGLMDRWLAAIERDKSRAPLPVKVLRNKPADATDSCWIDDVQVTDAQRCRDTYPWYATPRMVAGMPLTNDILRCRLQPMRPADYPVTFTARQWRRLRSAFPDGVCDWSRRGVAQQPSTPWTNFSTARGD